MGYWKGSQIWDSSWLITFHEVSNRFCSITHNKYFINIFPRGSEVEEVERYHKFCAKHIMRVWWMAFISTHLIMLFSDIASIKFTIRIYLQPTTTLLTTTIIPHILIPVQSCPFCGQIKCECKTSTINACNIVDLHRWPYICRNIYAKFIAFLNWL